MLLYFIGSGAAIRGAARWTSLAMTRGGTAGAAAAPRLVPGTETRTAAGARAAVGPVLRPEAVRRTGFGIGCALGTGATGPRTVLDVSVRLDRLLVLTSGDANHLLGALTRTL